MTAIAHTPTNKLENSIEFYTQLGFKRIDAGDAIIFTDGQLVIEINPDRKARAGIKLFKSSWAKEVEQLKDLAAVTSIPNGYLLSDASGVFIYLVEGEPTWQFEPAEKSFSALGNYSGLTLETTDMKRSGTIYEALGFTIAFGTYEKSYMSLALDGFTVTLMKPNMCPHLFFNPSFSYFNGKEGNPVVIAKVRELGIPIAEEVTHFNKEGLVDNIIIRDPGGVGFFLFND